MRERVLARFRAFIERVLPWYDPAAERRHRQVTEEIRQHGIRTRLSAEQLRRDYQDYGGHERLRLGRR